MMDNKDLPQIGLDSGQIAIMCPADRLGDFIIGLLGKPQTIERTIRGDFMIGRDDLLGINSLIEKRVHDQAEAQLVQFVATIHYSDGLSVEICSVEEFSQYAEVQAHITEGVSLTWIYIIKFRGKPTPEKQQIEVTFISKYRKRNVSSEDMRTIALDADDDRLPGVIIRITHTMRSWGMDLESLISGHVRVFLNEKKRGIPRYMAMWAGILGFVTFVGVFSICIMVGIRLLRFATRAYTSEGIPPSAATDVMLKHIAHKIDILYSFSSGGGGITLSLIAFVYIVMMCIFSIMAGVSVGTDSASRYPSCIVFTQRDERHRSELLAAYAARWQVTAVGFVISVIGGVVANYYTWLLW
jgi:hypothetical protein